MYIYIYKIEIGKKDTSKGMGGRGERDMKSNMYISMKLR